ncbi:carboxypeptidase-like regulatory domain-containing protein [Rhizosphaericola mali]|nr:carboxypeptidase-like regulatory domain-containing protein [Rhizosphaericola mali]
MKLGIKFIQKTKLKYFVLLLLSMVFFQWAQAQEINSDSSENRVVELFGVIMTADSLRPVPAASVIVESDKRGTIANDKGIFSIAVLKGEKIKFSSIGYKDVEITIPQNIKGNQYSVIQLMTEDTVYLPATIIRARPTPEEFARDFLNTPVDEDMYEIARQNNNEATRRALMDVLPMDGKEAYSALMRQKTAQNYYKGQLPPMNLLNPFAWSDFIKSWKRGDYKSKNY